MVSNSKTSRANAANPLVVRCTGMSWALGPIGRRAASSWYEFLPCREGLYDSPPPECPGSQSEGSTHGSTQQYANRLHAFPMLAYCFFFFFLVSKDKIIVVLVISFLSVPAWQQGFHRSLEIVSFKKKFLVNSSASLMGWVSLKSVFSNRLHEKREWDSDSKSASPIFFKF